MAAKLILAAQTRRGDGVAICADDLVPRDPTSRTSNFILVNGMKVTNGSVNFVRGVPFGVDIDITYADLVALGAVTTGYIDLVSSSTYGFYVVHAHANLTTAFLRSSAQNRLQTTLCDNTARSTGRATFTLTDKPNEGSTITIRDADGTSVVFEIDNEGDGGAGANVEIDGIYAAGGGYTGTSADLVAKINAQSALNIVASNPYPGKVVLMHGTAGTAGNVAIAVNDQTHWDSVCSVNVPTALAGGSDDAFLTAIEVGNRGANSSVYTSTGYKATENAEKGARLRTPNNNFFQANGTDTLRAMFTSLDLNDLSASLVNDADNFDTFTAGAISFRLTLMLL
jgi:hypothetical protein